MFIGGDSHAIGRTAKQNTKIALPVFYGLRHSMGIIRIIAGRRAVRTHIDDPGLFPLQVKLDRFFVFKARMIGADGDLHSFPPVVLDDLHRMQHHALAALSQQPAACWIRLDDRAEGCGGW